MASKKTQEVWAGPGVLSMGRGRKIKVGQAIPKEVPAEVRTSLRGKGMIKDEVVPDDTKLSAIADKADKAATDAEEESEQAKQALVELTETMGEARTAVSTAKSQQAKASKADKEEAGRAVQDAEEVLEDLADSHADALAEVTKLSGVAVRLRMEADKAAEAAK